MTRTNDFLAAFLLGLILSFILCVAFFITWKLGLMLYFIDVLTIKSSADNETALYISFVTYLFSIVSVFLAILGSAAAVYALRTRRIAIVELTRDALKDLKTEENKAKILNDIINNEDFRRLATKSIETNLPTMIKDLMEQEKRKEKQLPLELQNKITHTNNIHEKS